MVWIQLPEDVREAFGLADGRLPVSEQQAEALQQGRVSPEKLVDDVDRQFDLLDEDHPARPVIADSIVKMSMLAAVELLFAGFHEAASYVIRIGLRHAPEHVGLHAHLGLALAGLGAPEAATKQLAGAVELAARRGGKAPLLWILTARALSEQGRHNEAVLLLEDLIQGIPNNPGIWQLLASERELAAAGPATRV